MNEIFDLAIIGGGPAGVAGGIYAARKKMKTLLITEHFRGQSAVAGDIQNWIGEKSISGDNLAKKLEDHLKHYSNEIGIKEGEIVKEIEKIDDNFLIKTTKGEYFSKTVLIATGSIRRKLNIIGADIYDGKGISYCATCDGPMYGGMDIAIIGGGNSAFEAATQLLAYAKTVTIIQRSEFRAEPIMIEKVFSDPKAKGITNIDLLEIKGDKFVSGLVYKNKSSDETIELPVQGIFVEIGANPSVEFVKNLVKLNNREEVITDPQTQKTSVSGIWAAGDCTDGLYRQNNIAVGDAVKAVEDIYKYLKS